ncbi:MAG: hypothetical protein QMD43_08935 [Thermodesulfovibrio sp.]|uniref:hypothetical protein n=1 Tax=unclassified Thermodesulfovibrio TaxID=2645936 RepID=UPI00083B0C7C|nr:MULTISPECIES: hypothetical protein [unclassified Thermodesulfovibrio]MDI1471590.1 hypothetical protein [Thermodesulfovibrio sp. 1176]MDI6715125.1 hypothetical protein [Thermodesulfovibrio sp.]ODA44705.1 hypothetical protein THER_0558 [Thermodesulfovibrio sp. N1]
MEGRTKSLQAIASDIAEGFVIVNPIFLKKFKERELKELQEALIKKERQIRAEPFPFNDAFQIRQRNMKLQRIAQAMVVLKNFLEGRI